MPHYFDSSALVKLVVVEAESDALRTWLADAHWPGVTSDITITEVLRAIRRVQIDRLVEARQVLAQVTFVAVTPEICERAAFLDPLLLRSADAIHLATALDLADDLDEFVTYDERLADAARAAGVATHSPG
ncbi:type II toxin-antitoxin system VapC family toxin [Candidatus Poriferisodalis sp.]|uniref:type II toxin-antitoxin system VapC family toxin n=1 Tax=Candidatus Poriferisodalis sp. TaxID=3101277 RepID=UPI003AF49A6B